MNIKPTVGSFSQAMIHPKWKWFWDYATCVFPLHEGTGRYPIELVSNSPVLESRYDTDVQPFTWNISPYGPSTTVTAVTNSDPRISTITGREDTYTDQVTVMVLFKFNSSESENFGQIMVGRQTSVDTSDWTTFLLSLDGGGTLLRFGIRDTGGTSYLSNNTTLPIPEDRYVWVVGSWITGDTPRAFIYETDGTLYESSGGTVRSVTLQIPYGHSLYSSANNRVVTGGDYVVGYSFNKKLTENQIQMIISDPFGAYRVLTRGFSWVEIPRTVRVKTRGTR